MNKIIMQDDTIKLKELDAAIQFNFIKATNEFDVNSINIKVLKDTYLEIDYEGLVDHKLNIFITVSAKVNFNLFEKRMGSKLKIQYKYDLDEDSNTIINKFYDCAGVKELDIVNLNGINANFDYHFKTISKDKEKYDLMIYHNNINTKSSINNAGVNIKDGKLVFNMTTIVPNNKTGCVVNQVGKIVTLNDLECMINPNLLIEENDIEASHSALIGKFRDEELFYLMSRGIEKESAINLLTKGFLLSELDINENRIEEIKKIIDKYWR